MTMSDAEVENQIDQNVLDDQNKAIYSDKDLCHVTENLILYISIGVPNEVAPNNGSVSVERDVIGADHEGNEVSNFV